MIDRKRTLFDEFSPRDKCHRIPSYVPSRQRVVVFLIIIEPAIFVSRKPAASPSSSSESFHTSLTQPASNLTKLRKNQLTA